MRKTAKVDFDNAHVQRTYGRRMETVNLLYRFTAKFLLITHAATVNCMVYLLSQADVGRVIVRLKTRRVLFSRSLPSRGMMTILLMP